MNRFSKVVKNKKSPAEAESNNSAAERRSEATLQPSEPLQRFVQCLPQETLKQYIPIRNLAEDDIELIPHTTEIYDENAVLFVRGEACEKIYYLLEGEILLQPDSENDYRISFEDTRARLPLNCGALFGATATAVSRTTLLIVSSELNHLWSKKAEDISSVELIDIELPEQLAQIGFFQSFSQAYRENNLSLPSLPDVAFKLKEAMENNIGVNEAVEIIQLDAPIVSKLIQVANSSLYSPVTSITNCHDAVTRLGLAATRNLVMGISLKQLFRCKDPLLMKGMQTIWKNSLYLSSLSFILARDTDKVNPEDALLAGLIADIGFIPLMHFAEQNPSEQFSFSELEQAMPYLRAPVGALVLHTLGFSEELTSVPKISEDWYYQNQGELNLFDIIILAKLHSYISQKKFKGLPYINSIPAYSKLKQGQLAPDFSLAILLSAQQRVNDAMKMLA